MDRSNKQIKAWRNIVAFACVMTDWRNVGEFISKLVAALDVEARSDLKIALASVVYAYQSPRFNLFTDISGDEAVNRRKIERAIEDGKQFDARLVGEQEICLFPRKGIALTASPYRGYEKVGVKIVLSFDDAETGTKVLDDARGPMPREFVQDVVYEDALYLQADNERHWVWSKGSSELLGLRVASANPDRYKSTLYRVAPLKGEAFVVYGNSAAANELGCGFFRRGQPEHPDSAVFASVGPFSLALKVGVREGRRPAWDRIVAFRDDRLPIRERGIVRHDNDDPSYEDAWDDKPYSLLDVEY